MIFRNIELSPKWLESKLKWVELKDEGGAVQSAEVASQVSYVHLTDTH